MNDTTPYQAARMCPVCGNPSKVHRSVEMQDGTIHRKRRCLVCGRRFRTIEQLYSIELAKEVAAEPGEK